MRRKVIAGNWKMNLTPLQAKALVEETKALIAYQSEETSKEDLEKTKGTLAWLYEYWEQNNRSFPSGFGNTDIRIVSRNNEIVGISKCYIGKEYGNELGERLTSFLENTIYVGALEQIGLSDKNIEDVKT